MREKSGLAVLLIMALLILAACAGEPVTILTPPARIIDWENFAWEREHFADLRQPLPFDEHTTHGYLAVQQLRFMNDRLYGRVPFSYREKEAAVWLVEELLAMGHPWEKIYVQEFPLQGDFRWWNLNHQPRWRSEFELRHTTKLSQNVILTVPGRSERQIIAGAHYDSWPTPGATDNASGTTLLLESAQRILHLDHYYTIVYVFFGAHETGGFLAADHFVQNLSYEQRNNTVLMINADNLFDGPYIFYGAGFNDNLQPGFSDLTRRIDTIAYELDLGLISYPRMIFNYIDQLPFLMNGFTVVVLSALSGVNLAGYTGFFSIDGVQFTRGVSHTANDDLHIIEARWPGRVQTNMRVYSLFLEKLLLQR